MRSTETTKNISIGIAFLYVLYGMFALPFAYLKARAGGIGVKIFGGIMLGMSFQLFNALFSNIGLLGAWPAYLTALTPPLAYFLLALIGLKWVSRS